MLDLMNPALCQLASGRVTYENDGYMCVLMRRVQDRSILVMTKGDSKCVDLDDGLIWKQKKVCEKAVQFLTGIEAGLITSKILQIGLRTLQRDQCLTAGIRGNIVQELLKHGYSEGTAKAQGNQIITLFRLLKITDCVSPHRYFLRNDSLIYEKAVNCL